jgi:hypothetical protein
MSMIETRAHGEKYDSQNRDTLKNAVIDLFEDEEIN